MRKRIYTVEKGENLYYYGESKVKAQQEAKKRGTTISELLMFKKLGVWITPTMEHANDYAEILKQDS